MQAVLRVIDQNKKKDYPLGEQKAPIKAQSFTIFSEGSVCRFQSSPVLNVNGETITSGMLKAYDAFYDEKADVKYLVVPEVTGDSVLLKEDAFTVGRVGRKTDKATGKLKYSNLLELHDPIVSGKQCIFFKGGNGRLYVTDLDSTNGTFIDEQRLAAYRPFRLKPGAVCTVGPYRFTAEKAEGDIFLRILNGDGRVSLHPEFAPDAIKKAKEYESAIPELNLSFMPRTLQPDPVIFAGPRRLPAKPEYEVTIESAPSMGTSKPGLGNFGIGVSIPAMAIGFGMSAIQYALSKKKYTKAEKERADFYARYTSGIENELAAFQKKELTYYETLCPKTDDCQKRAKAPFGGLWERHAGDEDFLSLRLGTGDRPSGARIEIPQSRLSMHEDIFEHVPEQIKDKYALLQNAPIFTSLQTDGVLGVVGERTDTASLIKSMVIQLAALHNYDDLKLVLLCSRQDLSEWDWMRWLPHVYNDTREYRYIFSDKKELEEAFKDELKEIENRISSDKGWSTAGSFGNLPYYVFIVLNQELLMDNTIGSALMNRRDDFNISGIVAGRNRGQIPYSVESIVDVKKNGSRLDAVWQFRGEEFRLRQPEAVTDPAACSRFAREIAPVRLSGTSAKKKYILPENVGFFEGNKLQSKEDIRPDRTWGTVAPEDSMAVPIGLDENGEQVMFDIHEKAHGVHGLIVGGTGSGKTSVIQSWIASMACKYSPEDVNFVLVDFKGTSLVEPFWKLPHLSCFTSNQDPDVGRKLLAVKSELMRRQELMSRYGCLDLISYRKLREKRPDMPSVPFLILVVDEFANFRTEHPEFIEPLDQLFQQGRSLGFFVILMAQNPSGKITAQMDANISFRWCLRVKDESQSREVIHTPDAGRIRNRGRAYFTALDGTYKLLQAFYGGLPYDESRIQKAEDTAVYALHTDGSRKRFESPKKETTAGMPSELETICEVLSDYCKKYGIPHAQSIWQDELPDRLDLQKTLEEAETSGEFTDEKGPAAIVGLFDDPAHQRQSALCHYLWKDGTLAVYGAPQSGKTTFLETFVLSLASRHDPSEAQFYILEYGGYHLEPYARLPHTGGYANDKDPECMKRILTYLLAELDTRSKLFHKLRISSCEGYYQLNRKAVPAITLIVDNLNSLLQNFDNLQESIAKLIKEGAAYGINVVMSLSGTSGMYQITPFIRRSFALRLGDPGDYSGYIGAPVRKDVSGLPAGRGYIGQNKTALEFQTAVIFADGAEAERKTKTMEWIRIKTETYHGPLPEPIRSLPEEISYGDLKGEGIILGMDSSSITPFGLPFTEERSLLLSYKSYESFRLLMKSFIRQVQETGGEVYLCSKQAADYESLLDSAHLVSDPSEITKLTGAIHAALKQRQTILKSGSGTSFPRLMLIIDGLWDLMGSTPPETSQWLEAFIKLSAGMNYAFVGADLMEKMTELKYSAGNILAITARKGPCMITGGRISDHRLVEAASLESSHPAELSADEAVISVKEELHILRLMRGE